MIDSFLFTPGPVGGLEDVPGGTLKEPCRVPIAESWSRPAGGAFSLGHYYSDKLFMTRLLKL